jgi:hypothetical protein
MTIHKHEMGAADFQTVCGQTYHIEHGQLRMIPIQQATDEFDATKCNGASKTVEDTEKGRVPRCGEPKVENAFPRL